MKKQEIMESDMIFCSGCPAEWANTPDANCFICNYFQGVFVRNFLCYVKCNYLRINNKKKRLENEREI